MPEQAGDRCPKCEQPRQAGAVECPYCGIIYERYRLRPGDPATRPSEAPAPEPPPPRTETAATTAPVAGLDQIYRGPLPDDLDLLAAPAEVPAGAEPPPETTIAPLHSETVFTRNLAVSIGIALILLVLAQGWWQRHIFGGSESLDAARQLYTELAGIEPPRELDDAATITLVGRRLVLLMRKEESEDRFPTLAVLYYHGSLAGFTDAEALQATVARMLGRMGIPWYEISDRSYHLLGEPVPTRILGIGSREQTVGRVLSVAFSAPDGQPALLVLTGPSRRVADYLRENFY